MALGRRQGEQQELWVATTELPRSPGHPFYQKLNQLLAESGFDAWIEARCRPHYASDGRPSIPPGVYFRMILVGYFEGIASQRGIAWRCSDSLALRSFLGIALTDGTPEHSSLTRIHQRLPLEVHEEVFRFVLQVAYERGLVKGQTVAVDATTLEANAAMKSIVRKDSGEDYREYLARLAREAGIANPTAEELTRFDRGRKDKTLSNAQWESATDADAKIAKMKDGTTHLAYKAEHVIDLETEVVLAAEVLSADRADVDTVADSVLQAEYNLLVAQGVELTEDSRDEAGVRCIDEVVADCGYHAVATVTGLGRQSRRTYLSERPRETKWQWDRHTAEERKAIEGNRRRVRGERGKRLQRLRSEKVERSFAHVCATGGARRCWLRGFLAVAKRYLLQVAGRNLGLVLRKLFGLGTARGLQGRAAAILAALGTLLVAYGHAWSLQLYWRLNRRAAALSHQAQPSPRGLALVAAA
jgi:transposase